MTINKAFIKLSKRAEKVSPSILSETFVDAGMLIDLLEVDDSQIIFGRRGTGKTHALLYFAEKKRLEKEVPIFIDMRVIGSSTGIFFDTNIPLAERATRLLRDTLSAIHEKLLEISSQEESPIDISMTGEYLDALIDAATQVSVVGHSTVSKDSTEKSHQEASFGFSGSLSLKQPAFTASATDAGKVENALGIKEVHEGRVIHKVRFGAIAQCISKICENINGKKIWLLLDEWSAVPSELQPYLADLLRRSLLSLSCVSIKIAAIELRSNFLIPNQAGDRGDYVGMEIGADISADLNLDDFMVFDNDAEVAVDFFKNLIFKHYTSIQSQENSFPEFKNINSFTSAAFTQINVLEELVRAAEGVPRDAINILANAAVKARAAKISIANIRDAAKIWYTRDKYAVVSASTKSTNLLNWIIDEVIAHRRARAFLVRSDVRDQLIDNLFDSRVIHLLKRNISSPEGQGKRYDVFKIDYGCYVDLMATTKSPQGLLPFDDACENPPETDFDDILQAASDNYVEVGNFIDVPPDDYRAIRRAILDLDEFYKRLN